MATRVSAQEGSAAPIQIQAQFLRDWPSFAQPDTASGFLINPGEETRRPAKRAARRNWREKDVERAIGAAKEAGLTSYRVEIAPDGTISIVVGGTFDEGGTAPDERL